MFHKRLCSSILIFSLFVLIVTFSTKFTILPLIIVNILVALGASEFYDMAKAKGMHVFRKYGIVASVALITVIYLEHVIWPESRFQLEGTLIFFIVSFLFVMSATNKEKHVSAMINIFITLGGIFYVSWLFSFILRVNFLTSIDGRLCLVYLITITKITDVGAYIVGSIWGKNKLAPAISPNKTREGTCGGIMAAAVLSMATGKYLIPLGLSLPHLFALGFVIGTISQIGDLAESILKRDAGIKDSANYIPGMGGVLDLTDSMLFTSPLVYFYLTSILGVS